MEKVPTTEEAAPTAVDEATAEAAPAEAAKEAAK